MPETRKSSSKATCTARRRPAGHADPRRRMAPKGGGTGCTAALYITSTSRRRTSCSTSRAAQWSGARTAAAACLGARLRSPSSPRTGRACARRRRTRTSARGGSRRCGGHGRAAERPPRSARSRPRTRPARNVPRTKRTGCRRRSASRVCGLRRAHRRLGGDFGRLRALSLDGGRRSSWTTCCSRRATSARGKCGRRSGRRRAEPAAPDAPAHVKEQWVVAKSPGAASWPRCPEEDPSRALKAAAASGTLRDVVAAKARGGDQLARRRIDDDDGRTARTQRRRLDARTSSRSCC